MIDNSVPPTPSAPGPRLLSMNGIGKSFSGIRALNNVSFDLLPGETHILAGENGAGKSTLVNILSGVHTEYEGSVSVGGGRARFRGPVDATLHGISMIHQDMSLAPAMSVADNLFLGRELTRCGPWLDRRKEHERARDILNRVGLRIDLSRPVGDYPISVQQMIEIAKALVFNARIFVMDEPTSALSDIEVERLFAIIRKLQTNGCGVIYITHRMKEIYAIGNRVTVLRDGRHVGTGHMADVPEDKLVRWMVGRKLNRQFPKRNIPLGNERLSASHLSVPDLTGALPWAAQDVSLNVRAGEVLGLAGLHGSGSSELLAGLFGVYGSELRGSIAIDGRSVSVRSPRQAIAQGMGFLTNNRRRDGLVPEMTVTRNITRASLRSFAPWGWLRPQREFRAADRRRRNLNIRLASLNQSPTELSGGNQQKVVLATWLETRPCILLLDEPTRGIDVGAKHEIYELMSQWSAQGMAILLITSEMPELLAMSDRILVMHRGRAAAEFSRKEASQEKILQAAMGNA